MKLAFGNCQKCHCKLLVTVTKGVTQHILLLYRFWPIRLEPDTEPKIAVLAGSTDTVSRYVLALYDTTRINYQ